MNKCKILFSLLISLLIVNFIRVVPLYSTAAQPVAGVMINSNGIYFSPKVSYGRIYLKVSTPDGLLFQKEFDSGSTPYLGLSEISKNRLIDGHYTYELHVSPWEDTRIREESADAKMKAEIKSQVPLTQSGHFLVRDGAIITPSNMPEPKGPGISTPEQAINEDLYVVGSLCVGTDCASPETWGYDVIRLKENNLSIHFDDTSATSSFPANDWRIVANDTEDGGANYFAVEDATSGDVPFKIEAGAPENSLYIEDYGRIGIKTSTPGTELHIVDGDSPAVRLEQDTTSGWTAQVWDIAGNETNFFVRDITNSSTIPFRIQPGAPSSSLCIKSDGKIGIGTWSPAYPMELDTTGINACILVKRTDGASNYINATDAYANFGSTTNHPLRLIVNSSWKMRINTDGSLTMSNGASLTTGGVWTNASSGSLKENIQGLTNNEAIEVLNKLTPVKYNYKVDKTDNHIGFIAEDSPELVVSNDKKGMSPMDIVAVLTKVVQEQQKIITQLQEKISQLEKNK